MVRGCPPGMGHKSEDEGAYQPVTLVLKPPLSDQEGNFLSPFDFLRELRTFFLFRVAFKRFVLFLFFIFNPLSHSFLQLTTHHLTLSMIT
jgi:hypothetical protein